MNWVEIFNRLWRIIDQAGATNFSGPRFLDAVREVNFNVPPYGVFIETRRASGRSTSRSDYFYDILMDLDESSRCRVLNLILEAVEHAEPQAVAEIRGLLGGSAHAPAAAVPPEIWNSGRLNGFLADIDAAIGARNYDRAVTLSYTCLEGFYGAFFRAKAPGQQPSHEILVMSRWIRDWIRASIADYPDEVLNLINHTSHAVDRARNRFSEAHFAGEAGRWLAVYVRDIVNTQIRLLLHFL